ncbi:MAG: hypothetical protein ACOX9C_01755 [Kiritimatiellia bacterium]|jgi:hypothetical protein
MKIADKSTWYENRRDELLALLKETARLKIPESLADELKAIRTKCLENQFEIVLVGEFQGGKSTTFNALCDGRDLSPRGLGGGGIKTSAAIVSAQNVSGDETRDGLSEWAEITFKTKYQIQQGMFDIVKDELLEDQPFRKLFSDLSDEAFEQNMMAADAFASFFDLDNGAHRAALRRVLDKWWDSWSADKSSLEDDELDQLRIATLQERFYGTPQYQKATRKTVVGVNDFQTLITFPKEWMKRWMAGEKAQFDFMEVAFVFVHSTLLRIRSEGLARLGCRVTDCPGLFANAYDTAVARRAILVSDGVWYLIGGEKQVGQKDLKILGEIKKMGMAPKMTASVNWKGSHEDKRGMVFEATESDLKNRGFTMKLHPYNARLSFLAAQGDLLLNHPEKFTAFDRKCMKVDSRWKEGKPDSPAAMWAEMVRKAGQATDLDALSDVSGLTKDSVAAVRKESDIDDIMTALGNEIVEKKARSILVDNGSAKAAKALEEYESALKVVEDAATRDANEWEKAAESAETAIQHFVERAKADIADSELVKDKDFLAERLANDLFEEAVDDAFLEAASKEFAEATVKVQRRFMMTLRKSPVKVKIMDFASPGVSEAFRTSIIRVLESWKHPSKNDSQKPKSLDTLKRRTEDVGKKIDSSWQAIVNEHSEFLTNFEISLPGAETIQTFLSEFQDACLNNKDFGKKLNEVYQMPYFKMIATIFGVWFDKIHDGIKRIKGATDKELDTSGKERIGRMAEKLVPEVKEGFEKLFDSVETREKLSEPNVEYFMKTQDKIIDYMQEGVNFLGRRFILDRYEPAKKDFEKAESERIAIAKNNHRLRVEKIEPIRKKIRAFERKVRAEL